MSAEPWLRGGIDDLDPVRAALLYSFQHAREDIAEWASKVPEADISAQLGRVASLGFHIRHIAGSVDRLMTYAAGGQLSEEQMSALRAEGTYDPLPLSGYLALLDASFAKAEATLRGLDPAQYGDIRDIGRRRVPVPLGVLLVHIAEHTQRHVGQIVMTVKMIREEYR
jgi:uncharacterized damage-inducible protein DinB